MSWQKESSNGSFVAVPGKDGEWVKWSSVIQLPKDAAGTYRCVAINTLGSDNKTEKLQSVGELLVSGFNTETIAKSKSFRHCGSSVLKCNSNSYDFEKCRNDYSTF